MVNHMRGTTEMEGTRTHDQGVACDSLLTAPVEQSLPKSSTQVLSDSIDSRNKSLGDFYQQAGARVLHFVGRRSRLFIGSICIALVGVIGVVDYLTGYERSLLVIYLAPVALGTWKVGRNLVSSFPASPWRRASFRIWRPAFHKC